MSIFHDPASLMHQARKQLQEKTLTPAETKKKEEIVKSMKSSASDFEKRYPGRGKEVMYATATKQAKKDGEIEEVMKMKDFMTAREKRERSEKEKELSPTRRAGIHTPEKKPERDARRDAAYGETGHGGALRAKKVRKAKALGELGEAITGGSAPNVPAGVAKFVDELPQKVTSAAKKVKKMVTGEEIEIEVINHLIENGFAETEQNAQKIMDNMSESWAEEIITELNRLEREQGKESGGNPDKAYQHVAKMMRSMSGKPEGQRKKVPGKKPPKAGEYGSGKRSPAQEVQLRRAQRKRSRDNMSSPRD